jgi:hypothetical protein
VGLQETRRSAKEVQMEGDRFGLATSDGFWTVPAGYTGGTEEDAAGVAIKVNRRVFVQDQVKEGWTPPATVPSAAGRAIMVRIKGRRGDLAVFSVYLPCGYNRGSKVKCMEALTLVMRKVAELLERTTPIILLDANAHVGRRSEGGKQVGWVDRGDTREGEVRAVGCEEEEEEDEAGARLAEAMEGKGMVLLNTFYRAGRTYFKDGRQTRPDYVAVPAWCMGAGRVAECRVMYTEGRRLQMVEQVEDKLDHYPLKVKIRTKLEYNAEVASVRWDYEKLRKALREGTDEAIDLNRMMAEVAWEEGPSEEPMRKEHGREREPARVECLRGWNARWDGEEVTAVSYNVMSLVEKRAGGTGRSG